MIDVTMWNFEKFSLEYRICSKHKRKGYIKIKKINLKIRIPLKTFKKILIRNGEKAFYKKLGIDRKTIYEPIEISKEEFEELIKE